MVHERVVLYQVRTMDPRDVRVGQHVVETVDSNSTSLGTVHERFYRPDGRIRSVTLSHFVTVGRHTLRTVLYWCVSEQRWKNKLHRDASYSFCSADSAVP